VTALVCNRVPVGERLKPYLDIRQKGPYRHYQPQVYIFDHDDATVAPFQKAPVRATRMDALRCGMGQETWWAGTMFVVCHNQPPIWHQLLLWYKRGEKSRYWLERCRERRPGVTVHMWEHGRMVPDTDWFTWDANGSKWTISFVDSLGQITSTVTEAD
jgi:hypothetical protein